MERSRESLMNHQERIENLNRHIEAGTLLRKEWGDGHERACLLAALSPESSQGHSPSGCPASVMPQWLAHLTLWMDDAGSEEAWPVMVRRYANLASRWRTLSDDQWSRLDFVARKIALESCLEHNKAACEPVLRLLDQSIAGDHVPAKNWDAARAAARAARAAARAASNAANAAAAVYAAVNAAAVNAAAAYAAADAAYAAADTAYAAVYAAADTAYAAAGSAAADHITTKILDAIEAEIEKA